MLIVTSCKDTCQAFTLSIVLEVNLCLLYVAHDTTHVLLRYHSSSRSDRSTHDTRGKVMGVCDPVADHHAKVRVYVPSPFFETTILEGDETFEFSIRLNSSDNSVIMVPIRIDKLRFPNLHLSRALSRLLLQDRLHQ